MAGLLRLKTITSPSTSLLWVSTRVALTAKAEGMRTCVVMVGLSYVCHCTGGLTSLSLRATRCSSWGLDWGVSAEGGTTAAGVKLPAQDSCTREGAPG